MSATTPSPLPRLGRAVLRSPLLGALTTPHPVDRYLELVRPAWTLGEVRAQVTAVRHLAPDCVTLTLRPNRTWQGFRAGQYVRVSVEIDGVRHTRPYSPACSALGPAGELELTVREHPQGRVSTFLNRRARPGLVLGLSQADGDFALPDRDRPPALVLISGGTGITPVMSMLRTLCDEHHTGPVTFLHYARSAAHVPYAAELERLAAANPNVTLARAYDDPGVPGELTGLFSGDHLDAVAPRHAQAQTFVCGPPPLMDAVGELHARRGLEHALHVERFVPPPAALVLGDAEGDIAFAATGTTVANDGATLLEQAERAGLRPDSGCRMGICHTCTCRKVAGGVRDVRTGEVSTAPDEDIQICISIPLGDVELCL